MTKVTHFVYDGMMLHVIGSRDEVIEILNEADHNAHSTFVTLPVIGHDGQPADLTFSLMGSIIVMDDHEQEPQKPTVDEQNFDRIVEI